MTRAEHLKWCKERAHEYVTSGDFSGAMASMMSDLRKHPETASSANSMLMMLAMPAMQSGDRKQMADFIDGFN